MTAPGQGDDATWAGKLNPPGALAVKQAAPLAANVVGGRGAAAGEVILTVPAGRTWRGTLHLAGQASNAIGAAAATHTADLVLAGVGAVPAPGTILSVAVANAASTATATSGTSGRDDVSMPVTIVAAAGAPATVTLAMSAGMTAVRASARGELIA